MREIKFRAWKNTKGQPVKVDERTWFYSDKWGVDLVHELYEDGIYKKTVSIRLTGKLLDDLGDNLPYVSELMRYIPVVIDNIYENPELISSKPASSSEGAGEVEAPLK